MIVKVLATPQTNLISTTIYPNPAASIINIDVKASTKSSRIFLRIYDVYGKVVYQKEVLRDQQHIVYQVDVSKLLPGTYFVQIGADSKASTLSFIKL